MKLQIEPLDDLPVIFCIIKKMRLIEAIDSELLGLNIRKQGKRTFENKIDLKDECKRIIKTCLSLT